MVHSSVQSIICLELHSTFSNNSPKDVTNIANKNRIWNALENALKNEPKGANECKIRPIKK